jgi:hypothetical protein
MYVYSNIFTFKLTEKFIPLEIQRNSSNFIQYSVQIDECTFKTNEMYWYIAKG